VYLISRVYEYRLRGFTTDASILRAMEKQSTTITTAGLIMAIAFSSLLLSNTTVLNQFGFVLVAASLVDTFVVRTMLVPALLFFATEKNWWPGPVPAPNRTTLVGSDDDDDDDATDACCGNCAMSS
jgi:putative drug exporter of the RND superfamily